MLALVGGDPLADLRSSVSPLDGASPKCYETHVYLQKSVPIQPKKSQSLPDAARDYMKLPDVPREEVEEQP